MIDNRGMLANVSLVKYHAFTGPLVPPAPLSLLKMLVERVKCNKVSRIIFGKTDSPF